jgi:hypothetical protein
LRGFSKERRADFVLVSPLSRDGIAVDTQASRDDIDTQVCQTRCITMAAEENTEQDLLLLNEENAIRVIFNETEEKYMSREWLEGKGRAAESALAKQVLGTKEGFQGSSHLTIEEELLPVLDALLLWLSMGDKYIETRLTEENSSSLHALAQYFALDKLEIVIKQEQARREEEARKAEEEARKAKQRVDQAKCFRCGVPTTVPRTYIGNKPSCENCLQSHIRLIQMMTMMTIMTFTVLTMTFVITILITPGKRPVLLTERDAQTRLCRIDERSESTERKMR